jgi:hypothetical protein
MSMKFGKIWRPARSSRNQVDFGTRRRGERGGGRRLVISNWSLGIGELGWRLDMSGANFLAAREEVER